LKRFAFTSTYVSDAGAVISNGDAIPMDAIPTNKAQNGLGFRVRVMV